MVRIAFPRLTTPPQASLTVRLSGAPGGPPTSLGVQGPRALSGGTAPVTSKSAFGRTGTGVGRSVVIEVVLVGVGAAAFAASRRHRPD